jgi:hypothetical protein
MADTTDVVLDPRLNGTSDVYALSFRTVANKHEAWLTLAQSATDDGKRVLATSTAAQQGFAAPQVIADEALNSPASTYDGVPTFHPCDPTRAVFVSDRPWQGSARG